MKWGTIEFTDPDWQLDQRDPEHPEIIPRPFLDYYLLDDYPLPPEYNTFGEINKVSPLSKSQMEDYLPEYQSLFPKLTLKDMGAVRMCDYEWYDGSGAMYLSSNWDDSQNHD